MALEVVSAVITIVMTARMTSPTAWRLIGLKPMAAVEEPQPFTPSLELVRAHAIIGAAVQLTVSEVQPFT
jgi:hypothetical protein